MPKLTREMLEGVLTDEAIDFVLSKQDEPRADRPVWYRVKLTAAQAAELQAEHPEYAFERPKWKK